MKFFNSSLILASVLAQTNAASSNDDNAAKLLRKATDNMVTATYHQHQQRQLQGGGFFSFLSPVLDIFTDPCTLVNDQFEGNVQCTCTGSLVTTLDFTCPFTEPVCLPGTGYCATPTYKGQLSLFSATSLNEICLANFELPNLPPIIGDNVGDLCVELNIDPSNDDLLTCEASLGNNLCLSCTPCGDDNGGFGIALGFCGDSAGECTPLTGFISNARDSKNMVTPFLPSPDLFANMPGN